MIGSVVGPRSVAPSEHDRVRILGALDPQQRAAAEATEGPVAILAGAGTGKTTTVTHRIAWQVAIGAARGRDVLAVTFTDKAAGELRARLHALDVEGVEARTFHGAARWMLSVLWPAYIGGAIPDLLPHKIAVLEELVRDLPMPDRFRPRREFAQEIEWARNRRVDSTGYLAELEATGHEAPTRDAHRMQTVFRRYEDAKRRLGVWDFEDLLARLDDLLTDHPEAAARLRTRFRSVTVDEYQDVNPLQHALLDHWVSEDADICVVGDDYQTIYSFTGASPQWLLTFPQRYPGATVVRLETSYRSTPQIVERANTLAPALGGFPKMLRAIRTDGPEVKLQSYPTRADEASAVAGECQRLHDQEQVGWSNMAVLYRINARSAEFEAAFHAAGVPCTVTSGGFLERHGPRSLLRQLERSGPLGEGIDAAASAVREAAIRCGWSPDGAVRGSDEAQTLQEDLARLVDLAELERPASLPAWARDTAGRFATGAMGPGVQLLSMHRAKGLEWDAVFLPRLNDRELPFRSRTSAADLDDERRLLYVGVTRARTHLTLSHASDAGKPSPFLVELGFTARPHRGAASRGTRVSASDSAIAAHRGTPLFDALRSWRGDTATGLGSPAYVVFDNKTLAAIAAAAPRSSDELLSVAGVGPAKLERFGEDVLRIVRVTASA